MGKSLSYKIVYFGSPDFSAFILEEGLIKKGIIPSLVVTNEDKVGLRGHRLIEPEVKKIAKKYGIEVLQPKKLKDENFLNRIREVSPHFLVVCAYGKILPKELLDIPKIAPINIHASILPRWRGASPIQYTILMGDRYTGVTIMKMTEGLDCGPLYLVSERVNVEENETAKSLSNKLSLLASQIIKPTLEGIIKGELKEVEQEEEKATYAPKIKKEDGKINFEKDATAIERMVRAFNPWPLCYFYIKGVRINVYESRIVEGYESPESGVLLSDKELIFSAKDKTAIRFTLVQREGKKILKDTEFLKGFKVEKGTKIQD